MQNKREQMYKAAIGILATGFAGFHVYTGLFGVLPSFQQRGVHVGLGFILALALYPVSRGLQRGKKLWMIDIILMGLVAVAVGYVIINSKEIVALTGQLNPTVMELIIGVSITLIALEVGRRTVGWVFPIITGVLLAYTLWGQYIPGHWGHPPIDWRSVFQLLYLSPNAIWGSLTGISATYIALFIIFGAILLKAGGGQTFTNLAFGLVGKYRGGPAKAAVISSATFGTISGSSVANVAMAGSFTIPMMKRMGYRPEFAGAVEAVSGAGGQITPPIMGSAAFITAEMLGVPYFTVVVAAIIPAFLFYVAVYSGVHFEALRTKLAPIPAGEVPPLRNNLRFSVLAPLVLPVVALLWLLFNGYSETFSAGVACAVALAFHIVSGRLSWAGIKKRLKEVLTMLEAGGRSLTELVPILVCANILVALLSYAGLSIKLSGAVMSLGEQNVVLAAILTGLLVMFLGMGLPTPGAYVLAAVIAAPMLIGWGLQPMAAHIFILYYAVLAVITPPVCPAAYVAARIAGISWVKVGWAAMRLALINYFVPFIILFQPALILMGTPARIILAVFTAIVGAILLAVGTIGYLFENCNLIERFIALAGGVMLLIPGWQTDLIGLVLGVLVVLSQKYSRRAFARFRSVG